MWYHPSSKAITATPSLHITLLSLPSPSLPITYTYRSPRGQLYHGPLLNVGVGGEVHVGIHGAFGLDQVRVRSAFGHICCLGLVARGVAAEALCYGGAWGGGSRKGVEVKRREANEAWCVYRADILGELSEAGKTRAHARCCGSVEGHGKGRGHVCMCIFMSMHMCVLGVSSEGWV